MSIQQRRMASAVAGCCAAMFFASAEAEPTPVTAQLLLSALADPHVVDETVVEIDNGTKFQVGTLNPMTASAQAADVEEGARIITRAVAHAEWKSPSAGSVDFYDMGWKTKNVTQNGRAEITGTPNNSSWYYTFTTDADSVFTIRWDIKGRGTNLEGLDGFQLLVNWAPFQTVAINTSDSVSVNLAAGQTYTIALAPLADTDPTFVGFPLGTRTAFMNARFHWKIEPR